LSEPQPLRALPIVTWLGGKPIVPCDGGGGADCGADDGAGDGDGDTLEQRCAPVLAEVAAFAVAHARVDAAADLFRALVGTQPGSRDFGPPPAT